VLVSKIVQNIVIVALLLLSGSYFYLNAYKTDVAFFQYRSIAHGDTAPLVKLMLGDKAVVSHRLRSSDLFDISGKHQLSFLQITPERYEKLKNNLNKLHLLVDGKNISFTLREQGNALKLVWEDRKLAFVRQNDLRAIATNAWWDSVRKNNIVNCVGKALCQSVKIYGEGWGGLEGPYLDTDERVVRRGLPRGRWLYGPASKIIINSKIATKVIVAIKILRLSPKQKIAMQGPLLARKRMPVMRYEAPYGGQKLYPWANLIKLALHPGKNEVILKYSIWHKPGFNISRPIAAYLTGIKIKRAKTPRNKG